MQEELRSRLCDFLVSEGVTQKFIANKICVNTSVLSRFKTGQLDLESVDCDLLDDFLLSKGYPKQ